MSHPGTPAPSRPSRPTLPPARSRSWITPGVPRHPHRLGSVPGVGDQFAFPDDDGGSLSVLLRHDGGAELQPIVSDHHRGGASGGSSAPVVIALSPSTTRSLAAALAGHATVAPDLLERLDGVVGGLSFDWLALAPDSPLVGRSIQEAQIRSRDGVTLIAVLRGPIPIVPPEPDLVLTAGDELVVVGRAPSVERFVDDHAGGG